MSLQERIILVSSKQYQSLQELNQNKSVYLDPKASTNGEARSFLWLPQGLKKKR